MYDDDNMDFIYEEENGSKNEDDGVVDLNSFKSRTETPKGFWGKMKKIFAKKEKDIEKPRSLKRTILTAFLVCVISVCLILGSIAVYLFCFFDYEMEQDLDELTLNLTTTIYVQNSESGEWEEYQRLYSEENRIWIGIDTMPQQLLDAFVAIEDERFYEHAGVDWKRTGYAFLNSVFKFAPTQGGSTIDQQLVKNLTNDKEQSASRKLREIMRALDIDKKYSKDTILECYLNTISLGGTMCGVEVASNYYFGKPASQMTLNECAALAAMTKGPEIYRPDIYPEENKERRKLVLDKMLSLGKISQEEYDAAMAEELVIVASNANLKTVSVNSYFVDTLIEEVIEDLMKAYDYDKSYAEYKFYTGGYKIYATVDPAVQNSVEQVFLNTDRYFTQKSRKQEGATPEAAMTVMDYEGHIVGIVGGKGVKDRSRGLNRAYASPRQPGSTMKPIGSYALAVEKNMITYSSMVNDQPIKNYFGPGRPGPRNHYGSYKGDVTVKYALQDSVNTIPCKLIQQLTPETSYNFLTESLGLKHLTENDINLSSLGIGGCEYGMTTTESAGAFAIFGNGGVFYEPTTYYKITDQTGKEIILEQGEPIYAVSEETATVMNRLLQNVINGGTGGGARGYSSLPTFAKTGTSDASNNLWFVGGSPYYVASVWYGFDLEEKISNQAAAQRIWVAAMKDIHTGLKYKDFEYSKNVVKRLYCNETGLLATANCPSTSIGYYKKSYMPVCSHGGAVRHDTNAGDITSSENVSSAGETTSSGASQSGSSSSGSSSTTSGSDGSSSQTPDWQTSSGQTSSAGG